jgi:nicotinamidase-related amidase
MSGCRVGQLITRQTALFLCDMQEKFRQQIQYFSPIVEVSSRLLKAAKILNVIHFCYHFL